MSTFIPQLKCSELGRENLVIETVYSRENCGYSIIQRHLPETTMLMKGRTNNSCVVQMPESNHLLLSYIHTILLHSVGVNGKVATSGFVRAHIIPLAIFNSYLILSQSCNALESIWPNFWSLFFFFVPVNNCQSQRSVHSLIRCKSFGRPNPWEWEEKTPCQGQFELYHLLSFSKIFCFSSVQ